MLKIGDENIKLVEDNTFDNPLKIKDAVNASKNADVIILALGEFSYTETPGNIPDLNLPDGQIRLAEELIKTGKPVILVLIEGRPRLISTFENKMKAVIMSYLPGNKGGDALASLIYGDINPSGKLPFNYPRYPNALVPYDHKNIEEADFMNYNPQYHFGFGLSYTTFEYSDLKISRLQAGINDTISIEVSVKNTGELEGKEVVQLYIKDLYASITPPVKRLRGFNKVNLKPGERKIVVFKITGNDLSFINAQNKRINEPGDFEIQIEKLKQTVIIK
jgi:beta-glucosidase